MEMEHFFLVHHFLALNLFITYGERARVAQTEF
jgi:hypothetical protein